MANTRLRKIDFEEALQEDPAPVGRILNRQLVLRTAARALKAAGNGVKEKQKLVKKYLEQST